MNILFILLIIQVLSVVSDSVKNEIDTLMLVHVLFRHGNRTFVQDTTYPNDPYFNETFFPFGYGQLTNKGKLQEYHLGQALRKRYNEFLGDLYMPEIMEAVSTNTERTKMSLELVLAGLFPPSKTILNWNSELNWQPIPYRYLDNDHEHVLSSAFIDCPRYLKLYNEFLNTTVGLSIRARYAPLFKFLSKHTGWNVTTNSEALTLYTILAAEDDYGLKLPKWTANVYPTLLNQAGGQNYVIGTYTPELRQLSGGFLLKKIIKDTRTKIKDKLEVNGRKLYLYSAHDGNVAWLLGALKILYPHQPNYGAYILIEVHKIENVFGFKIFYQNYLKSEPIPKTIPGCDHFCPFEHFISLVENSLPKDTNQCYID